jgi:Mitochondrial carrier protein
VSRTATAPFDRLRVFLITRPPDLGGASLAPKLSIGGIKTIASAVARIYTEGGVLAFWTGNGLSVAKIFPESAIKFFTYESSVRLIRVCVRPVVLFHLLSVPETVPCQVLGQGGGSEGCQWSQPVSRWRDGRDYQSAKFVTLSLVYVYTDGRPRYLPGRNIEGGCHHP